MSMQLIYVDVKLVYVNMQFAYVDIHDNKSFVNISLLHVDITKLHDCTFISDVNTTNLKILVNIKKLYSVYQYIY